METYVAFGRLCLYVLQGEYPVGCSEIWFGGSFLSVTFTLPPWFGPGNFLLWLLLYIVNSFFLPYPWPPQITWITFLLYYNLLPACYIGVSRSSILGEVSKDWGSWLLRVLKTGCYWSQSISTFLWVTGKFWCWCENLGVANSLFPPWCALKTASGFHFINNSSEWEENGSFTLVFGMREFWGRNWGKNAKRKVVDKRVALKSSHHEERFVVMDANVLG